MFFISAKHVTSVTVELLLPMLLHAAAAIAATMSLLL